MDKQKVIGLWTAFIGNHDIEVLNRRSEGKDSVFDKTSAEIMNETLENNGIKVKKEKSNT